MAHIKSRTLLPQSAADDGVLGEGDEGIDPRAELVRRLLEYQKFKEAAAGLGGRPLLDRDVFLRAEMSTPEGEAREAPLAEVSLFALVEALRVVLQRMPAAEHEVTVDRITVGERIAQLSDRFRGRTRLTFAELFDGAPSRADVIVTFLAILEMTKLRVTRLYQAGPSQEIYVELAVVDDPTTSEEVRA